MASLRLLICGGILNRGMYYYQLINEINLRMSKGSNYSGLLTPEMV